MVPNQYRTPGAYAPMAIVGKYYMYYGREFLPPRELGRGNAAACAFWYEMHKGIHETLREFPDWRRPGGSLTLEQRVRLCSVFT